MTFMMDGTFAWLESVGLDTTALSLPTAAQFQQLVASASTVTQKVAYFVNSDNVATVYGQGVQTSVMDAPEPATLFLPTILGAVGALRRCRRNR